MKTRCFRALLWAVAVSLFAGCSESGAIYTPQQSPDAIRALAGIRAVRESAKVLLYLSSPTNVDDQCHVDIFSISPRDQFPIGQISDLAGGGCPTTLWVDKHENLFVAVSASAVPVFHRGSIVPFVTLLDPGYNPLGVCGDNVGHVYVTDSIQFQKTNTIEVYKDLGTKPASTLVDPNAYSMGACAVDSWGDLFVAYFPQEYNTPLNVDEFPKGKTKPITLISGVQAANPYLTFDSKANLLLTGEDGVEVYRPPYTNGPSKTLTKILSLGQFAVDSSGTHLWTVDFEAGYEYAYPSEKLLWYTALQQLNSYEGLATSPALSN